MPFKKGSLNPRWKGGRFGKGGAGGDAGDVREGDGGSGGGGFELAPAADEEHVEDGALGGEAMADENASLAGDAGASALWDLFDDGEDFEDLTAVGVFLLRQFANNVVVELPGAGEGVVFAPLHFALGASRRLWASSLDAPFAEILRASDFVALALRSSVGVFAAKSYLDATLPLLPLFIIEVGKKRQAVGLVATYDGALIVRSPPSLPRKARFQLRSPSNSVCQRLSAAVFSPQAAGALGSAFVVPHAGTDVTVYFVQELVARLDNPGRPYRTRRNLRHLGHACYKKSSNLYSA
jgi:hypothetical protein